MRCPHCATPNVTLPDCSQCALPVETPSETPPLVGLETTEEVLGDVSIPGPNEVPVMCRCLACGYVMTAARERCLCCGERM